MGRQLYARLYAHYMHDQKHYAVMSFKDLQSVTMHKDDTKRCLADWDYVWERLGPNIQDSLDEEFQVDMFFELIRKAPQHSLHFGAWDLYSPDRNPVECKRMHSMQWLRDVINDHYDRKLRDHKREAHHAAVRQGVPGLWRPESSTAVAAPPPAPK